MVLNYELFAEKFTIIRCSKLKLDRNYSILNSILTSTFHIEDQILSLQTLRNQSVMYPVSSTIEWMKVANQLQGLTDLLGLI